MAHFEGQLVDLFARRIYPARIVIRQGRIAAIEPLTKAPSVFLLPGFVDAHIHIESSLLTPSRFAPLALAHGTVATVSDPHEIANVLGIEGIDFMIEDAQRTPLHIAFGAPSCVPATPFETSGAVLDADAIKTLLERPDIGYLSEMMNYPGVIDRDPQVMAKIEAARQAGKPIDGHAPGLRGEALKRYARAGIATDHECTTLEEAEEKIALGMKILIREGSAAKNYEALAPLLAKHPERVMFCSDDRHPDDLLGGHIDRLAARAVADGFDLFDILRAASLNAIDHYNLPVGMLRVGDRADFVEVEDLRSFRVLRTVIGGETVAQNGQPATPLPPPSKHPNRFEARPLSPQNLRLPACRGKIRVIEAHDGSLLTGHLQLAAKEIGDPSRDLLKIVVLNRYEPHATPALGAVRGFGLKRGAMAASIAHDSHNLVAVGCDDDALATVLNAVIAQKGALAATDGRTLHSLPLPVAGLMSDAEGAKVAAEYARLRDFVRTRLGSPLASPFMTLSFMALPVIPELKLTDRGLFDARGFDHIPLCSKESR